MSGDALERACFGRSRRGTASRAAHAELDPKKRNFDPLTVLKASAEGRLRQLLPMKYERMKASPFAFFRGSVAIMAADLARLPHSGLTVQLCGDAHVQNLGSFAAPDGKLVFDFNDFDETIAGPWEWDVKRMATSIVLAGREVKQPRDSCRGAAEAFVVSYCAAMAGFTKQPILEVARRQIHRQRNIEPVHAALVQSERANPCDLLRKLTKAGPGGRPQFRDARPDFWRVQGARRREILTSLQAYRATLAPERRHVFGLFRPVDIGFKVVGTGSVGLRDYVVLFEGNGPGDPMFLQIKQEAPSAYARYLPAATIVNEGQRVAEGQRAIQPSSDLLLGWTSIGGHDFLVRQMNDHKGRIDMTLLRGEGLASLAQLAGELLARGHARSGDACAIHGYCGTGPKIVRALRTFAIRYADQTEWDYQQFLKASPK